MHCGELYNANRKEKKEIIIIYNTIKENEMDIGMG